MSKSLVFFAFAALLCCSVQAQTAQSIKDAQDALSVVFRVSADGLGRAGVLKGVLEVDVYNSLTYIRASYVTLGVNTTNLDNLEATWTPIFESDLNLLINLTRDGLAQNIVLNKDLTENLNSLQLHLLSLINILNQADQAYQLASQHIDEAIIAFNNEITGALGAMAGQPVIDAFRSMQKGLDIVTIQHNIDDELILVVDWRARQAIAAVQAVISQLP